jgi:hypothetical protein
MDTLQQGRIRASPFLLESFLKSGGFTGTLTLPLSPAAMAAEDRAEFSTLQPAFLSQFLSHGQNRDPAFRAYYQRQHDAYNAALNPVSITEEALRSYVGTCGPRTVTLEGGSLFSQREGEAKIRLTPIADGFSPPGPRRTSLG